MTVQSEWRASNDAAEVYGRVFVQASFGQWEAQMVAAARVARGDCMLGVPA
jgi:hypothetical protein